VRTRFQKPSRPRTWVPHISLVFREMWDSTELDSMFLFSLLSFGISITSRRSRFAESHISRKTSEIWGTQVRGREGF